VNSKIERIDNLLNQFGCSQSSKCGFMFYIGGSMLIASSEDEVDNFWTAQHQLPLFDINEEIDELLGPLKDLYMQGFFEELIWRLDVAIEPRKVTVPGTDITTSEFTFKNRQMLKNDDSKIKNLFDAESVLNAVFEGVGSELLSQDYDLTQSYKAGICFFNVKSQVDTKCTKEIINLISQVLTPTLSSVEAIARAPTVILDGYTNIQLALHSLIYGLDEEFLRTLWAFQSFVFFNKKQEEIPGIADLPIEEFIEHCSLLAAEFYNDNRRVMVRIAKKQVHMTMFPSLQNGIDERPSLKEAMQNIFGVPEKNTSHSDINLKAATILSYFSVICETTLSSSEKIIIQ